MAMSEQISGTHGRAEDDAIKRQDRTQLRAQGDEWPAADVTGDEAEAEATWAPEGRFAGTPPGADWMSAELRSDLARLLHASSFPATRAHLVRTLTAAQAPQRLIDLAALLPADASYANLGQLVRALGLHVETRSD
jgi:hypothetical protein